MKTRQLFVICVSMVLLSACGAWKPEKLEAATSEAIDNRLTGQMPLADFRSKFPDAVLVDGNDIDGAWFVSAQHVCFWCRTSHGFQRSMDVYARVVKFEDGKLTRVEPASQGGRSE